MTVHDLSPWRYPEETSPRVRWRTPWLLRLGRANQVITPSEAIRRELLARFRFLKPDRVTAIPLAAPDWMRPMPGPPPAKPYFLFVGTTNARKGLAQLIDAWRGLAADLVIVGRQPVPIPAESGLRHLGPVADEKLPGLYSQALAVVYPSEYEGFGLPVVEAMQCGAPVIISADPALQETAGGAALVATNWREALHLALSNPAWRADSSARSLRRAAHFDWRTAARLTRQVYERAMEDNLTPALGTIWRKRHPGGR
jgi:alpha-1,3-rhamnosyl/mannosyltransferase